MALTVDWPPSQAV